MTKANEDAVRQTSAGFYAALNAMFKGDLAPMKALWSHGDDIVYMPPDGTVLVGWKAILASWETQAEMNLGGEIASDGVQIIFGVDMAVTMGRATGHNFDAAGVRREVLIRDTNIYRFEAGTWKMVGHHSDPLPFLQE